MDYLIDQTIKKSVHILYAIILLIVGLAFVASWSYFKYQELEIQKQQQKLTEAALIKEAEDRRLAQLRNSCLTEADDEHMRYLESNGKKIKGKDGSTSYWMSSHMVEIANNKLKDAQELCFKKYPTLK